MKFSKEEVDMLSDMLVSKGFTHSYWFMSELRSGDDHKFGYCSQMVVLTSSYEDLSTLLGISDAYDVVISWRLKIGK